EKDDQVSTGLTETDVTAHIGTGLLSSPSHKSHASITGRKAGHALGCAVVGTVVNNDVFPVCKCLLAYRLHRFAEQLAAIFGRCDYRNGRRRGRHIDLRQRKTSR